MAGGGLAIERERRDAGDIHALDREPALNVGQGLNVDHVHGQGHAPRGTLASLLYSTFIGEYPYVSRGFNLCELYEHKECSVIFDVYTYIYLFHSCFY